MNRYVSTLSWALHQLTYHIKWAPPLLECCLWIIMSQVQPGYIYIDYSSFYHIPQQNLLNTWTLLSKQTYLYTSVRDNIEWDFWSKSWCLTWISASTYAAVPIQQLLKLPWVASADINCKFLLLTANRKNLICHHVGSTQRGHTLETMVQRSILA